MKQLFKTIYFTDHPASSSKQKNLKLAFSERDSDIFQVVSSRSSHELRELIGFQRYTDLIFAAKTDLLPVNTYCLRILRDKFSQLSCEDHQPYLPGVNTINPIHATFKGGHLEPLHLWYPYLEGYSPEFVENIINEFAPSANNIFDPFAGTGTTPLTVARLGKTAFYSEINPLLQHLIDTKLKALTLPKEYILKVSEKLNKLSNTFSETIRTMQPDIELQDAYIRTFGESKFFDVKTYDTVLKSRALLDQIAYNDPLISDFLSVAIISSLVPASLLRRAGDLRYKTPTELKKESVVFEDNVVKQLNRMILDFERLKPIHTRPLLISEGAKNISLIPSLELDAIVTSPPYLNGTNYFRNTKIELWFLRCLSSSKDLSAFREKAITAGINDVSLRKSHKDKHPSVDIVVNKLKEDAYDNRIPKMVEDYFYDMNEVFKSCQSHLRKNAVIAIDIGDSMYGGIHVPTDKILAELLTERGFTYKGEVLLRKRLSRNGSQLSQVLLVFTNKKTPKVVKPDNDYHWKQNWKIFKKEVPHQSQPYAKRNWGHPLHSLCSYQGKMKPSLAHFLVKTFVPDKGVILDPFAGVGTIPFEGALNGIKSFGFEISPAARIIATAKVGKPDKEGSQRLISKLEAYIKSCKATNSELENAASISFNKSIPDYYEKVTLKEILLARRFFTEHPPVSNTENLVFACLLHILHGNRPYALSRRSHGITPFSPAGAFEYRPLIPRLHDKVQRSLAVDYPQTFVEGKIFHQDATKWWPQEINSLDAIITSPPFFDSTRFHLANWIRLWFCGWNSDDFKIMPRSFIDERQKIALSVYESIFRQAKERLKKDGVLVLHLGKSSKCDMAEELKRISNRWFRTIDLFTENVEHCESHGIRDKGTVTSHQYLVLQ